MNLPFFTSPICYFFTRFFQKIVSNRHPKMAKLKMPFPWFHLRSHRHILHVTQEPGHGIRDEGGLRFAPGAAGDVGTRLGHLR